MSAATSLGRITSNAVAYISTCLLTASTCFAAAAAQFPASPIVSAASIGARLDSDLLQGGGTDDTAILQGALDRAALGKPVHLIIEGAALVSGLEVYGNTVIECLEGGGFFLKDGSSRALIRNAHRSRDAVTDRRITLRGCFLNGNRDRQPSADILRPDLPEDVQRAHPTPSNKEADGTYMAGLQFMGVEDLLLENLTVWNTRAFGALVANAERVTLRNITIDDGGGPDHDIAAYAMTDGLHFKGPLRYATLEAVRVHVGDDALAFNADDYETDDLARRNDFGPYIRSGPITDVVVDGLQLMDTRNGVRLLSSKHRIDRISISNVSGIVRGYHVVDIGHWANRASLGIIGTVSLSNVLVDWPMDRALGAATPFLNVDAHIDALILRNIVTTVNDSRPILQLGPDADIKLLSAELHLLDPKKQARPIVLAAGSNVDLMNLSLDWQGLAPGKVPDPIKNLGGHIRHLVSNRAFYHPGQYQQRPGAGVQ